MQAERQQLVVESEGCRLHGVLRGFGEAVLFVQGTGVHGEGWRPQTEELARDYRCLSFDNRGIGASQPRGTRITIERMARDGLALLDAAEMRRAHVVGHSLGGIVALELALLAPERVRSLALLCTFANGREVARGGSMLWTGMRTRLGTAAMRRRAFLELILAPAELEGLDRDARAAELAPLFGHDLAVQPAVVMAQIGAFRACNLSPRLAELAGVPTLVVTAEHDRIAPPALSRAIAAGIPGARLVDIPGAAHGAPITHAARINALLREHFATQGARS